MKKKLTIPMIGMQAVCLFLFVMFCSPVTAQNSSPADTIKKPKPSSPAKEEENRNVMLNATSNTGPREVNIGLPSSAGGTTIMENDLPVVYYFWPELPNRTWRPSTSLSKSGLLSLRENANLMSDFGYSVNSYSKLGGEKFELNANLATSTFGWIKTDVNISGPIKNNWYYTLGAFVNYDPISYDPGFTKFTDKTQIFRAGITKRFNNGKGEISLLYKYASSASLPSNFAAFEYGPGGSIEPLDDFTIGRSSYFKRDGTLRLKDAISGEFYTLDLSKGNQIATTSHNVDLFGHLDLADNWKFKFSNRLHMAEATTVIMSPISIRQVSQSDGFRYLDDNTPYAGSVQAMMASTAPNIPVFAFMTRLELTKKTLDHSWRMGMTEFYNKVSEYHANRSYYFQEVADKPRQLANSQTDSFGYYNYNVGAEYHNGFENKLTAYLSDDWEISPKFTLHSGVNFRYQKMKGDFYEEQRTDGFVFEGQQKSYFDFDWFHLGATANMVYKITDDFGILSDLIYTEKNGQLEDFSGMRRPVYQKTKSPYGSLGLYYNHPKFSIVSALTYLTRNNYQGRLNLVNPENTTQVAVTSISYDIKTVGWTTDIVAKPFKGFSLHYLLTFQNPVYENYSFAAFGNNYSYDGNNVLGISKVLMEIDPSYTYKNLRIWASARSFSKQFANLTNALYFQGWWETFAGANYQINKKFGVGLTVVNLLNQNGAKGTINGAELINDPSLYYGRVMTSSYIRPLTAELSLTIKL